LDFGIARASKNFEITETTTQDTTIFDAGKLGALTPPYASCEMLENQEPDRRDDIYALGCVIYEILTNHHPFNKLPATEARFNKITPPPIPDISKKQNKALLHALAFNREERVSTIDQFLQEAQLSISSTSHSGIMLPWKWISIVLFLSIPAGIIWLNYNKTIVDKYLKPSEPSAKNNSDLINKPPIKQTNLPVLSDKDKQKILRLLEIAEMHFMIGKLVEPKGTNALEAYREVLLLSPNNQAALEGLNNIASEYEQQAHEQWKKGESTSSIVLLKKGLLASPLHQGLNELLRKINTEGK
jgi:serine/threonine protein kinase